MGITATWALTTAMTREGTDQSRSRQQLNSAFGGARSHSARNLGR